MQFVVNEAHKAGPSPYTSEVVCSLFDSQSSPLHTQYPFPPPPPPKEKIMKEKILVTH